MYTAETLGEKEGEPVSFLIRLGLVLILAVLVLWVRSLLWILLLSHAQEVGDTLEGDASSDMCRK